MRHSILFFLFVLVSSAANAQLNTEKTSFTRADSLRGGRGPLRTCYDIQYYHLNVEFDVKNHAVSGSNLFRFKVTTDFNKLQFDLFENLAISKVIYKGKELVFQRTFNAVFLSFPEILKKGSLDEFTVYYSGRPTEAKNAPWDGGIVYAHDSSGKDWVATACQGVGASIWWPNKDQQDDEPDSMLISISVPLGLKDVSNGRLRKVTELAGGYTRFDWFVSSPINNYDVAANIGDFAHLKDEYLGVKGILSIDYWVLQRDVRRAEEHFGADVKRMLKSFEYWLGPYPFYKDGYKLVETPYLGMEHQSAIAYGNKFKKGYLGRDLSGSGYGLNWDYITVHESGHEWFGNNITSKDIADMWIHEGFTTYSESLFVESTQGPAAAEQYLHGYRSFIANDRPIVGPYLVNKEGSQDMYFKGAVLLGMIRRAINDDALWRNMLIGLNKEFYHKTVTYEEVVGYLSREARRDLAPVFDQYLHFTSLPILELTSQKGGLYCRWTGCVKGFALPIRLRKRGGDYKLIEASTQPARIAIAGVNKENIEVDTYNYYIGVLME